MADSILTMGNTTPNEGQSRSFEIRTNGLNLFGADGNMIIPSYLDDCVNIAFCYPEVNESGKRSFPKENRVQVIVKRDAVGVLSRILSSDEFLAAVEHKGNFNEGAFLNARKTDILSIIVENGEVGLAYFKELGEDLKPKSTYTFKFQKDQVIKNYTGTSEKFEIDEIHSQLFMFIHMITWFEATVATKVISHGAKVGLNWNMQKELEYLRAVADKLGANIGPSFNNGGGSGFNNFSMPQPYNSQNESNQTMAQMETITNLDGYIQ